MLVTGSAFSFTTLAQKLDAAKVPSAVKGSFTKDFPGITAKWEKEKANYEAGFKQNGKAMSAVYNTNGNKIETEMEIETSALPAAVTTYVAQNYKGGKILYFKCLFCKIVCVHFRKLAGGNQKVRRCAVQFLQRMLRRKTNSYVDLRLG